MYLVILTRPLAYYLHLPHWRSCCGLAFSLVSFPAPCPRPPPGALFPLLFGSIVYPVCGLNPSLTRFAKFLGILTLESFAGQVGARETTCTAVYYSVVCEATCRTCA